MVVTHDICVICAWRVECKKKFSVNGRGIRCADFVKDLAFEKDKKEINERKKGKDT
ncbi:MAG: hypothetical protein V3R54_05850 [Thermodesulfovibrionia bacterium]